ncbi:ABC transporter ATP-binding protein [Rhodococcoides trifolii]|uniref:ABC transporter ATP-binding protein n=1 Tax=Rhodococcoides trifolii TaxID=908250 RepID=A0A917G1U8_9NOCA|nr:ABC transporter ATP-binding protein [Rhodococcus trifolii]
MVSAGVLDPVRSTERSVTPDESRSSLLRFLPFIAPYRVPIVLSIVISILGTGTALVIPLLTQHIVDGPIVARDFAGVWLPALGVLVLGLVDAGSIWLRRYLMAEPSSRFEIEARGALFRKLQSLSIGRHDGWDSGQLLSRAITDMSTLRRFVAFAAPFLLINTVTIVAGALILTWLSWILGVIFLVLAVPLILICARFESLYRVVSRRAQEQSGDVATTVEESIHGIRVLKAFGRSDHQAKRFVREARTLRGTELDKVRYMAILWSVIVGLPPIAIGAMLGVGAWSITQGTMTTGALVASLAIVASLLWPIEAFGFLISELGNSRTAADRYWEIMDLPADIDDPLHPVDLPKQVRGAVRFDGVSFSFPDADRILLHDVSFTIEPGETVALVGVTGSGKTALTSLIPRLYDVTAGSVTVDGLDVSEMRLSDLRSLVAVAFEEPALFSASVRENITMGRPAVTDENVWAALTVAHAEKFVADLPWGLDTRIGEQGLSLSGGQRQRLALARAVIGTPRILVLDDPLSALDVNTEQLVHEALADVLSTATTLLVAHRPSTAALADRVLLLDNGTIAAQGTHESLLATSARYRHVMGSTHG